MFLFAAIERVIVSNPIVFDSILSCLLVMSFKAISIPRVVSRLLEFLGAHSMNIFLFHTYIYYMWFKDWIYSFYNPLLIFMVLLIVCIAISLFLEAVKKLLKFDLLVKKISLLVN